MDWENAEDSSTPTVFYRTLNVEGHPCDPSVSIRIGSGNDVGGRSTQCPGIGLDVGTCSVPFNNVSKFVAEWHSAKQEPAICTVRPS
jgi:hypothetical protein